MSRIDVGDGLVVAVNEEQNVARAIQSLAGVPVVVVDDASEDQTARVAKQAGAAVITAPPLAAGLIGKPNA